MDQFEYVMVLVSIILGLGIAHTLLGVSGIVDRVASQDRPLHLSLAYFSWLGVVFVWTVLFWWWEFGFGELVTNWTVGLYLFLVLYAVALFSMAAIMVPRTWDSVDDLAKYFLQRRRWFYTLLAVANGLDVLDSYLKQGLGDTDPTTWLVWVSIFTACVVGFRAKTILPHTITGVAILALEVASAFAVLPLLSS